MIFFDQERFFEWARSWDFRGYFGMFAGLPQFESYTEMCAFFAQFGMVLPDQDPDPIWYICTRTLLTEAKTLRQRSFAYLFNTFTPEKEITLFTTHIKKHPIKPFKNTCRSLLAACYRDKVVRAALRNLPLARTGPTSFADPELEVGLQDLADIIAWEAHQAFVADYYPGVVDIKALTDEEVDMVMWGMQREMNREGQSRRKRPNKYADLPRERQIALAERRRYWFGVFGITPETWKIGRWNLWNVSNIRPPEGPNYQYKVPK